MKTKLINIFILSTLPLFLCSCNDPIFGEEIEINKKTETQTKGETYYKKYAWYFNEDIKSIDGVDIDKNAHINIQKAWDRTLGTYQVGNNKGEGVKIAVIDDGFDINHKDFKENVIAHCDMDNFSGRDILEYCKNNSNVESSYGISHGTSVAGLISSAINNKGIIGSAPKSKLILIKQDNEDDAQSIASFEYAKKMGAKVINCSWGLNNPSEILQNKLEELKKEGINIVFASGNGDEDSSTAIDFDEISRNDISELSSVLAVGATDERNDVTVYSNYGSNIDILAPGGSSNAKIYTTFDDSKYDFGTGTSYSAPIVSGVIALMISVNPDLSPDKIRNILIDTADKIGKENGAYYDSSRFDKYRAYGKVNSNKAVNQAYELYKESLISKEF